MSTSNPLVQLLDGPATAKAIGASQSAMRTALSEGVVKIKTTQKHTNEAGEPQRGRPARVYALTDKGRKRAKRAVADATPETQDAA